ncbi:6-phosphofructokinase [Ancrocorticia populi]|uniref:6-phosphofructokinase n=1 Tax=Ancrocorticia populi TaxID=2175228 RepID=UPI003F9DFF4E
MDNSGLTNGSKHPKIAVLTSGGDAQGMNAVVRAVVRTAIHEGAVPYGVHEGWRGAVEGGDLIREMHWSDVSGILNLGGTTIGTARCAEFRERSGRRQAVKNLVQLGIDRIIAIGGDGTLTGADALRAEWPTLVDELLEAGEIDSETAATHHTAHLAGVVGSIDNDLVGSDMTVGADSALHRILEAIDAISSTAASHQRTFVMEVMGRNCGYLALMSAMAGGCDEVFIPEMPPDDGWQDALCQKVRAGRAAGRRDSIIVVAEGAKDRHGQAIHATDIRDVLADTLGEDVRVTALGHVQRGGTPSAYDRWMSTLLGYSAALDVLCADETHESHILATKHNRVTAIPMMEAVANTRAIASHLADGNYERAVASRGASYSSMINSFATLSSPVHLPQTPSPALGRAPRVAILHAGGLAPGMNTAARAAVRLGEDRGFTMLGVEGGFPGLIEGNIRTLTWADVDDWAGSGGAELGTRRTAPSIDQYYTLSKVLETNEIDAVLILGGFAGYEAAWNIVKERGRYPAFNIPFICVPASIDNNLPGSELSIGADTALNNITEVLDRIKQSASASRRCFVAETMGRRCGYLALMGGISSGAEQVYLSETGITLEQLSEEAKRMVSSFQGGRNLYLVVRNEEASPYYTTDLMTKVFAAEGDGIFDVRPAILGHMQQGGNPSPFDRTLALQLTAAAIDELARQFSTGKVKSSYVGMEEGETRIYPITHMDEQIDMDTRLPYDPWWAQLTEVLYTVADPGYAKHLTDFTLES